MRTGGRLTRVEGTDYDGCDDDWDNQFATLADYAAFTRRWLAECRRVLKPNGALWAIGSMQCVHTLGNAMQELGYWLINDVVWQKSNPTPNFHGTRLNNSHETLIWAAKSRQSRYTFHYKTAKRFNENGKQLGSVWRLPVCAGKERLRDADGIKLHSTQKPLALLYRIVCISSSLGDTVLDPFAGTFTTGAAAKMCGRSFIGVEASARYCEAGRRRLDGVEERLGDLERATLDAKPPKVRLADLIAGGWLAVGERLWLKDTDKFATLLENGNVLLPSATSPLDIHTGAARLGGRKAARVNGFDFWTVVRDGGRVSLREIRDRERRAAP